MINLSRRVVCAALRNPKNGMIIPGARHMDTIMHNLLGLLHIEDTVGWQQGFINTWGEFLTREEAAKVAIENKQIVKLCGDQTHFNVTKLYSENLY